jgi:hypothetical protein
MRLSYSIAPYCTATLHYTYYTTLHHTSLTVVHCTALLCTVRTVASTDVRGNALYLLHSIVLHYTSSLYDSVTNQRNCTSLYCTTLYCTFFLHCVCTVLHRSYSMTLCVLRGTNYAVPQFTIPHRTCSHALHYLRLCCTSILFSIALLSFTTRCHSCFALPVSHPPQYNETEL